MMFFIGCYNFNGSWDGITGFTYLKSKWKTRVSTNAPLGPHCGHDRRVLASLVLRGSPCSATNVACANPNFSFTFKVSETCCTLSTSNKIKTSNEKHHCKRKTLYTDDSMFDSDTGGFNLFFVTKVGTSHLERCSTWNDLALGTSHLEQCSTWNVAFWTSHLERCSTWNVVQRNVGTLLEGCRTWNAYYYNMFYNKKS